VTGCSTELRRNMHVIQAFKETANLLQSSLTLLGHAYALAGWTEMNRNATLKGKTMLVDGVHMTKSLGCGVPDFHFRCSNAGYQGEVCELYRGNPP